ncbi:MAG: hypothetical protein IBJ18_00700 [Phycisphaerales bacterium]|nr:hypothetical protein [Phycisphaerales bacterium]
MFYSSNARPTVQAPITLLACMLVFFATTVARATDRFYPDFSVKSPDNALKLEAKSPDNANTGTSPGLRRAFQSNFTIRVTDAKSGRELWVRKQESNEASPTKAWLRNDARAVILDGWYRLTVVDAAGKTLGIVPILDQIPENEKNLHVSNTTAGPFWEWGPSSFIDVNGRSYFTNLTGWGRRITVDLSTGQPVPDGAELQSVITAARVQETAQAMKTLRKFDPKKIDVDDTNYEFHRELSEAMLIVAREQVKEAVPLLREIEKSDRILNSRSGGPRSAPSNEISPWASSEYTLRLNAQTALRRMGFQPAALPATQLHFTDGRPVPASPPPTNRAARVALIQKMASPNEVYNAVGAPDCVSFATGNVTWEYDIDTEKPYTLRVQWKGIELPLVQSIEKIAPPAWKTDGPRSRW